MYEDLRKFITNEDLISEETEAWYFKMLCEYCKDQDLVKTILDNLKKNRRFYEVDEMPLFQELLHDWHLEDVFEIDHAIFNLILSCFAKKYEISNTDISLVNIFFNYTTRGRKISGQEVEKNAVIDFFDDWTDMVSIFDNIPDDVRIETGIDVDEVYDLYLEETEYISAFVSVDAEEPHYDYAREFLEMVGFSEVEPGLFIFGCICYAAGYDGISELGKSEMAAIKEWLENSGDRVNLSQYDGVFEILAGSDGIVYLLDNAINGSSEREVFF